jgi:CRP-like cAMP-binding protein
MIPTPAAPASNALLGRLAADELEHLSRKLDRVTLRHEVLYGTDADVHRAYFPVHGLISVVAELESGRALEVATIGPEGMVGLGLVLGTSRGGPRVISRIPGEAFAISAEDLSEEMERDAGFHSLLARYSLAFTSGLTQGVACNGAHRARHRLARWLLVCQDAARQDDFPITQETLAAMLGVQRPTVSLVAEDLQRMRAISYRRGQMRVLDRGLLELNACECYTAVRAEYARLLN